MKSILLAFAMFTRLPMPYLQWDEKNMRYIMAAFPLVGVVAGLAVAVWSGICGVLDIGPFLRGTGLALVPFALTGGIHMDGFCDTIDALASHGDKEKKRRILKDPHVGPFAAFTACAYLLFFAALGSELDQSIPMLVCFSLLFVLSRTLTALALLLYPVAEGSSLGKSFHDAAVKKNSIVILAAILAATAGLLVFFGGITGAVIVAASLGWAVSYKRIAIREFGGISGDLSGWFLQLCELLGLALLVFVFKTVAL